MSFIDLTVLKFVYDASQVSTNRPQSAHIQQFGINPKCLHVQFYPIVASAPSNCMPPAAPMIRNEKWVAISLLHRPPPLPVHPTTNNTALCRTKTAILLLFSCKIFGSVSFPRKTIRAPARALHVIGLGRLGRTTMVGSLFGGPGSRLNLNFQKPQKHHKW